MTEHDVIEHRLRIGDRVITLFEGPAGWGEASPLPGYPCTPEAARRAALEAACEGFPPRRRDRVAVNALVEGPDVVPATLAGFPAVKVKLRAPGDLDVVARARDAVGPRVAVRVDANGAFDVETAIAIAEQLVRYDVELFEQPVASLDDLAVVRRRSPVPVAADEAVRSIDDARALARLRAADVLVVKVQPLGGVRAALDVVDAAGVPAVPTSMLETSVGLAAGLALACALDSLPFACGLGTAGVLGGDVTVEPLAPVAGQLTWRPVVPDLLLLDRYRSPEPSSQVMSS